MPDPIVNISAEKYVPVARPKITANDRQAVAACLKDGWVSGGPYVEQFERAFAAASGYAHGVACNSGTTALHLALRAALVRPGDRVILPVLTMVACANAVLYCGAIPVFCDSEPATGNMDPKVLDKLIREHRPAAVMPVALYGVPADEATVVANAQGCPLILDNSEAHGATAGLRDLATCSLATYSFYGNKIITTGEGGMVVCRDLESAIWLRKLQAHAFSNDEHFRHTELAYGYRMTAMQAALGYSQTKRLSAILSEREMIAAAYRDNLRHTRWIEFPSRPAGSVWWVFPLLVTRDAPFWRDDLRSELAHHGIETRTYFVPMHRQNHLRHYACECDYPVADDLSARGLYLPLYQGMLEDGAVDYVCEVITAFFRSVA